MILKLEQMNPTHVTQLSPTVYSLAPWAKIYCEKTVVMSGNNYSALHVTWVVITVFRPPPPQPDCILCPILTVHTILHCLLKICFHFFLLLMSWFSSCVLDKLFTSKFLLISSVYHALLVTRIVSFVFLFWLSDLHNRLLMAIKLK